MSERDDLSRELPEAPPPRPAQRRAAIESAIARFDGREAAAPGRADALRGGSRWRWPQLSVFATAALVGVVSVSLWNSGDYGEAPLPRGSGPATIEQAAPSQTPRQIFREVGPMAPAATSPPNRLPAAPPAPVVQRPAKPVPPPAASVVEQISRVPGVSYAPPPPPPAPSAPPPPVRGVRASVDTIVADDIGAFPDTDGIVVTGARTQGAARARSRSDEPAFKARAAGNRGDWNACTIEDPARSLAVCRTIVDPAASGNKGRADAQIADGLNSAWAGDARGAVSAFDRAIDLDGKSSLAYLNRGLARERIGDMRGALTDLNKAVRLSAKSARAYYHRSLARARGGDGNGARADARRALALDSAYRAVIR